MATATFRWDTATQIDKDGIGTIVIRWSERVSGFTAADITPSHSINLSNLGYLAYDNQYSYFFRLVDPNDADDFFITVRKDVVDQGNPQYTFPTQFGPPDAPTSLAATVSGKSIELSWTVPASDGGGAIRRYEYRVAKGKSAGGTWTTTGGTGTTVTVPGLDPNTEYTFEVRAVNDAGEGPASTAVTATTDIVAPDAPRTLTGTAAATSVALGWLAPASTGGSAIVRYEYRVREGSKAWGTWTTTGGTGRSFTVSGLKKGQAYSFEVRAVNNISQSTEGISTESNTLTVTTDTTEPGVPTDLTVTPDGLGFDVSWTVPVDDGGTPITKYEYRYRRGRTAGGTWTSVGTQTSVSVSGLRPNQRYTLQVRAVNAEGTSDPTAAVTERTERVAPDAPTGLSVAVTSTTAVLTWTAPASNGGSAITRYEYRYTEGKSAGGTWTTTGGTGTTFTITGLDRNTEYTFQVRAVNAIGNSDPSNTDTETTPQTDVSAPQTFKVVPTATTAVLTWTAPAQTEGATITAYQYRYVAGDAISGDWTSAGTALTATVTGLDKGTEYAFQVRAVIAAGAGIASGVVTATTETTVPGAPTGLAATPAQKTVALSWTAPKDDGGTPITDYEYRIGTGNWISIGGTGTRHTVTGLTGNTTYRFQVRAVNAKGESSPGSLTNVKTTPVVPAVPGAVTLTTTPTTATLGWTAPTDTGGTAIIRYAYRYREGSKTWSRWTSAGTALTATLTGLKKGTAYSVEVRAVNAIGESPVATATATTKTTAPTAPRNLRTRTLGTSVELSWTAPADNGGTAILRYEYRYRETVDGTWRNWATVGRSLSRTVSRLQAKTRYTFQVRAVNTIGESPAATASALTSQTLPTAPTAVTVVVLSGTTALLTWKSPGDVTGFQVNWAAGSSVGSNWRSGRGTQTSYVVTGLNRQTQYAFSVRGVNRAGEGARSQIKTATTPVASPHNALFFKECVNYIGGGVRVKKHGNPSQIIRSVADNDYGTFSQEKDYTVDISRNGAATRVDAFFVKCKGVSRHSGTPSGGSGSGWTHVTVPATVRNYEGRSVSTTVAGFQHHLLLLDSHFTAKTVRLQFQGSGVRIYEVMLLEFGLEIDANGDFTEIAPDFVDRSGEIRSGPGGRLSYGAPIGAGRDTWEIAYGVAVVPGKTLLQTPQAFLYWRSENRNHVHAMEPSRFPWRLFPATFVGDRVPVRYRTDDKTAGEILSFSVAER